MVDNTRQTGRKPSSGRGCVCSSERDRRRGGVGAHPASGGIDREPARLGVAVTFKDDGYSGSKEIIRGWFAKLIVAIEASQVDMVLVRDIDRLTCCCNSVAGRSATFMLR
jgi:hypothetical protein